MPCAIVTRRVIAADKAYLVSRYRHISEKMFEAKFSRGEYMVILDRTQPFGWLRWGYLWDEIPFINVLHIEEVKRRQGYGRKLVTDWEQLMRSEGYTMVLTSTLSSETAQHFYRKLGYVDHGSLLLPGEPLEIIFLKLLS